MKRFFNFMILFLFIPFYASALGIEMYLNLIFLKELNWNEKLGKFVSGLLL